jgi:hypothetical protein
MLCGVYLAACTSNSHPVNGDEGGGTADDTTLGTDALIPAGADAVTPSEEPPNEDAPTLFAGFIYDPASCDDHSVRFYGHASDGSSNFLDVVCHWDFGDGTTGDGCMIEHPLPSPSNVVLTVFDPVSGATGRFEEVVTGPLSFDASFDVTSSGLSISWHASTQYGPYVDPASVRMEIQPAEKVVVSHPSVLSLYDGSVGVTEAGTYTVKLYAVMTLGETAGCSKQVERTITVACDPVPDPI